MEQTTQNNKPLWGDIEVRESSWFKPQIGKQTIYIAGEREAFFNKKIWLNEGGQAFVVDEKGQPVKERNIILEVFPADGREREHPEPWALRWNTSPRRGSILAQLKDIAVKREKGNLVGAWLLVEISQEGNYKKYKITETTNPATQNGEGQKPSPTPNIIISGNGEVWKDGIRVG